MEVDEYFGGINLINCDTAERPSTATNDDRPQPGEGRKPSTAFNDLTPRKANFHSLREGSLSRLPIKDAGSAYQRINDPKFSNKKKHDWIDAQRPPPKIGNRSEKSVVQSGLKRHETSKVNGSSNVPLDRNSGKNQNKTENFSNNPHSFTSRIKAEATHTQRHVLMYFGNVDKGDKLEELQQSTLLLFNRNFEKNIGPSFYSDLIGQLTPTEQQNYLIWLTQKVKDFPAPQQDDVLKIVFQAAHKYNIFPAIFFSILNAEKHKAWALEAQVLELNFDLENAITLAKVLGRLPSQHRTNACRTLARIAFNHHKSAAIFGTLHALKTSYGTPMFDEVDLFTLFAKEAEKSGHLSDAGSLMDKIKGTLQKAQAYGLAAVSMKGEWTEELTNVFMALPGSPTEDPTKIPSYTSADLKPTQTSYSAASREVSKQINSLDKNDIPTFTLAMKSLYEKHQRELSLLEIELHEAVMFLPIINDELSRLLAKLPNTKADKEAIFKKRDQLFEAIKIIARHHEKRLTVEALMKEADPIAHHELMALRLRANFREKWNAHYKISPRYDASKVEQYDTLMFGKIPMAFDQQKSCIEARIEFLKSMPLVDQLTGLQVLINGLSAELIGTQGQAEIFSHLLAQTFTQHHIPHDYKENFLQLLVDEFSRLEKQGVKLLMNMATIKHLTDAFEEILTPTKNDDPILRKLIRNSTILSNFKDDDVEAVMKIRLRRAQDKLSELNSFDKDYEAVPEGNLQRRLIIIKAMSAIYNDQFTGSLKRPAHLFLNLDGFTVGSMNFNQVEPLIKYLQGYMLNAASEDFESDSPAGPVQVIVSQIIKWISLLRNFEADNNENPRAKAFELIFDQFGSDSFNKNWVLREIKTQDALHFAT